MKNPRRFLALWLLASPVLAAGEQRVFDIVPSEGQTVAVADGATVLRQSGRSFGVVLSFTAGDEDSGWIPAAVLNTGQVPLQVSTAGFTASHGDKTLAVTSNKRLVADFRKRHGGQRTRVVNDIPGYSSGAGVQRYQATRMTGPGQPRSITQLRKRDADLTPDVQVSRTSEPTDLDKAVADFEATLFPEALLAPGKFARGDLALTLPKRSEDGGSTFVLLVAFGDETMAVTYRERAN